MLDAGAASGAARGCFCARLSLCGNMTTAALGPCFLRRGLLLRKAGSFARALGILREWRWASAPPTTAGARSLLSFRLGPSGFSSLTSVGAGAHPSARTESFADPSRKGHSHRAGTPVRPKAERPSRAVAPPRSSAHSPATQHRHRHRNPARTPVGGVGLCIIAPSQPAGRRRFFFFFAAGRRSRLRS